MTSDIVVDCSVVVDLLVGPGAGALETWTEARWHAPATLDIEVVSALRGLVLGGHVSAARAADALRDYADLGVRTWPVDHTTTLAILDLRANLTAYDAGYVVLAQGLTAPLVTRDAALARAVTDLVEVIVV